MAEREGAAKRYSIGRSDRSKRLKLNEAIENRKQPIDLLIIGRIMSFPEGETRALSWRSRQWNRIEI